MSQVRFLNSFFLSDEIPPAAVAAVTAAVTAVVLFDWQLSEKIGLPRDNNNLCVGGHREQPQMLL